jgi:hypothetical protein
MSGSDIGHQRVVVYWTLHNDMGGSLACELSRTDRGLVLRCLDDARKVALSERVATAAAAVTVAAQWKARLLDKGDYFERPRASTQQRR